MKRFGTVTSLINVQFLVFSLKISFGPAVTRTLAPVPSFALFSPGTIFESTAEAQFQFSVSSSAQLSTFLSIQ